MADEDDEGPRSHSAYDYSDKSIRHAWIAVLAYGGLRSLSAIVGGLQQPAMAVWFVIDFAVVALVLGLLAFGIYRKSRISVVAAIVYVVATQLYVWFAVGSPAGTIIAVIVTGFLLRGAKRIFEFHRERSSASTAQS
jgi:hypothetical protein